METITEKLVKHFYPYAENIKIGQVEINEPDPLIEENYSHFCLVTFLEKSYDNKRKIRRCIGLIYNGREWFVEGD